jgi:hypothetical protein
MQTIGGFKISSKWGAFQGKDKGCRVIRYIYVCVGRFMLTKGG